MTRNTVNTIIRMQNLDQFTNGIPKDWTISIQAVLDSF